MVTSRFLRQGVEPPPEQLVRGELTAQLGWAERHDVAAQFGHSRNGNDHARCGFQPAITTIQVLLGMPRSAQSPFYQTSTMEL